MKDSVKIRFISALEKCFLEESIESKPELKRISMLKNEHLSVQLAYTDSDESITNRRVAKIQVRSPLEGCLTLRRVEQINVPMPSQNGKSDENFLKTAPGLFPDLLSPLTNHGCAVFGRNELHCLWIDIRPEGAFCAGNYPLKITFFNEEETEVLGEAELLVEIVNASLPERELTYTQWFHVDCLASYYRVEMYSEAHWQIIENYLKNAVDAGINMILTPVVTPPLDTKVGGERPTCQLVDVFCSGGKYSFVFERLNRWIDLLLKYKVKYIEICHLFTQWGAAHAPKIMATVDGEYKKIFGWETDAAGEEYGSFLRLFLTALLDFLKKKGVDQMCWFHVSDEPRLEHLENYKRAKAQLQSVLDGYPILDALSNFDFYQTGAVMCPVPANNHIEPFIEAKIPNLWTYYCCSQGVGVSNRFVAMPSARNRIIATQLYKFNIVGFLHWGYNFYYNRYSVELLNPYQDPCGEYFVPAGDAFSVYPAPDGTPLETIHFLVFKHALEDLRALRLCESLYDREFVMNLMEGELKEEIRFDQYPKDASYILNLREKVNEAIRVKCDPKA